MKGLNFLVLQFSLLPLVTGVYKFQVLVSFPSLHWRILTRGLDQHGGVGVSSEGGFVFNVPVWLIDHVPKNDLKVLTNSKYPTECTDFRRFFTIYSFFGSRLYYGRTRDICGKMPQNVKKKGSIWFPYLAQGIEWRLLWGGQIFPRATSCALFFVKNALWNAYFLLEQVDQFLSRLRAICARTLERSETVFPNLYSFSKKCHKNENAVFKTAKWTRILMHPKLMHSNFEFFWCTRSKMSVCT